jgi:hypothetical protein
MSIYSSLFAYRPRPERRPLEDFLSQALADLLTRAPALNCIDFVSEVLFRGEPSLSAEWRDLIRSTDPVNLNWQTQIGVSHEGQRGILDIVLRVNGVEILVIENKVGAPVRISASAGTDTPADGDSVQIPVANRDQLQLYGNWLASKRKDKVWKGALVLLTHFTKPPSDFSGRSSLYGVTTRSICPWRSVWAWVKRQGNIVSVPATAAVAQNADSEEIWRVFSRELADFLAEEGMSSDYMTYHDLAALELYVGSDARVENTFTLVAEKLDTFRRKLGSPPPRVYGPEFEGSGGVIYAWVYLRHPKPVYDKWHILWGVRFPSVSSDWWSAVEPPLPGAPHAFVAVAWEGEPRFYISDADQKAIPGGWSVNSGDGELIAARSVHGFRQDPEGWANDFADWVSAEVEQIYPMILTMASRLM